MKYQVVRCECHKVSKVFDNSDPWEVGDSQRNCSKNIAIKEDNEGLIQ